MVGPIKLMLTSFEKWPHVTLIERLISNLHYKKIIKPRLILIMTKKKQV